MKNIKNRTFNISTKLMSAFLRDLKLWLSYETLTVSKVLQIKCKTLEAVNKGGGRVQGVEATEIITMLGVIIIIKCYLG